MEIKNIIELKQIQNDYFLNGIAGDFANFNFNGEYKQKSYSIRIENNKTIKTWIFYGKLKEKTKRKYNIK